MNIPAPVATSTVIVGHTAHKTVTDFRIDARTFLNAVSIPRASRKVSSGVLAVRLHGAINAYLPHAFRTAIHKAS